MTHLCNALFCAVLLASSAFSAAAGLRSCPPVCPTTGPSANFCNLGVSGSLCVGSTASVQGNLGVGGNLTVCGLVTAGGPRSVDTRSLIPGCSGGIACTGPSLELEVLGSAGILDDLSVCGTETVNNLNVCNQTNLNNVTVFGTAVINNLDIGTGIFNNLTITGNLLVDGTTTLGGTAPNCGVTGLTVNGNIQANCSEFIADNLTVGGMAGFNGQIVVTETGTFNGPVVVTDTTDSTACTNGAVVIAGGLGVAGNINSCESINATGSINAGGGLSGLVLDVTGDAIIGGNLYVAGNEYLSGSLTATGVINANGGLNLPAPGATVTTLDYYTEDTVTLTFEAILTSGGPITTTTTAHFTRLNNVVTVEVDAIDFGTGLVDTAWHFYSPTVIPTEFQPGDNRTSLSPVVVYQFADTSIPFFYGSSANIYEVVPLYLQSPQITPGVAANTIMIQQVANNQQVFGYPAPGGTADTIVPAFMFSYSII